MYLAHQGIRLPCAVHPERPAVLDSTLRTFVNHEVFFFSDRKAKRTFDKDPLRYCGRLTDPVSRLRFTPTGTSPRWIHGRRHYYFSGDSTLAVFRAQPDSFAVRRGM